MFDLARSFERRKMDKELIRVALEKCIDLVDIAKFLPKPLAAELDYDDKKKLGDHVRTIADALYATRNQVAHAKSNYQVQGNEVDAESFPELNRFMNAAAVMAIRWYGRLRSPEVDLLNFGASAERLRPCPMILSRCLPLLTTSRTSKGPLLR